ncbi:MAG: leucine-rich repeat protein [Eubacteriales bacterium]|nr:leucine-rich repeat protein [Eubacteriales bacterium]
MKTRKRWAMLLSLVMAFSMLPAQAVAADVETEQTLTVLDKGDLPEYESYDAQTVSSEKAAQAGNLTWELNDGVLVISGNGEMTETPWKDRWNDIKSVQIQQGVTSIADRAFCNCTSLTSVTIPNSVTEISSSAFDNCISLTSVTIPNSVTTIGYEAFRGTPWLEAQGDFPVVNGILLTYQGSDATVIVPDSVTTIGDCAFEYCDSLTSVTIPNSVTKIGSGAFDGCTSLTSVTIPNSVTEIGSGAFDGCTNLTNVTIPNNVSYIAYGTFKGCSGLMRVTIPSSVKRIGGAAFAFCDDLTEIYFAGDAPEMVSEDSGWGSFLGVTAVAYYPKGASGWDEAIAKEYGGTLTWMEYDPSDPKPVDPTTPVSNIFTDITPNAWYTKAVQYVYDKGIMKGMGDATFAPSASMTRAMVAQIMYAQAGSPKVSGDMPFTDVPAGKWYYDAILWANQNGVVAGMGDGTFAPNSNITRQEYAAILYRYEKSPAVSGSLNFPDADTVSSWAKDAVLWANQNGIISGTANNGVTLLDPKGTATRAQSAVILMGYLEK